MVTVEVVPVFSSLCSSIDPPWSSRRHILGLIIGRADLFISFKQEPEKAMSAILTSAEASTRVSATI